jgi:DNA-binding transcriptional ArsR family regulator
LSLATKTKSKSKKKFIDQRLIKALAHPLRSDILAILNERVASPNELSQQLGEGLSQVSYHVKVLREADCIELVKTEPRRGAVEHFYRAIKRSLLTADDWDLLPESIRVGVTGSLLKGVMDDSVAALNAGTFDARTDSHLSWTPVILDEAGWRDLVSALAEALERVFDIQSESAARMVESGEEGISAAVALMGYEAFPEGSKKRGATATQ